MSTLKDIPGYEGIYAINCNGEVWSYPKRTAINGKWLANYTDRYGYKAVTIWSGNKKKNVSIHRLIALAFLPNPKNKTQINHINGIKLDNNVENLEWCTQKENTQHAWRTGLAKLTPRMLASGQDNARKKRKKVMQLTKEGILCRVYDSILKAHLITGAGAGHIGQCCIRKRKTAGGYFWAFPETYNLTF